MWMVQVVASPLCSLWSCVLFVVFMHFDSVRKTESKIKEDSHFSPEIMDILNLRDYPAVKVWDKNKQKPHSTPELSYGNYERYSSQND